MGEEPLHDPPLGQHHEAAHVVTALDDRKDQRESGEAVGDEAAGVAAVAPDEFQPVVRVDDPREQGLRGGAVAGVRGGDHHGEQKSEGVDHGVSLAAVDQLAAIESAAVGADDGVGLDGLGVDHPGAGLRVPAGLLADLPAQPVVELGEQAVVAPAAEEGVDPVPRREVCGDRPPFGSVVDQVVDCVQYRPVAVRLRLSAASLQPARHR